MTTKDKTFTTNFLLARTHRVSVQLKVLKIPFTVHELSDEKCSTILGHKTNITASLPVSYSSATE